VLEFDWEDTMKEKKLLDINHAWEGMGHMILLVQSNSANFHSSVLSNVIDLLSGRIVFNTFASVSGNSNATCKVSPHVHL
jgi:hypothetical protein